MSGWRSLRVIALAGALIVAVAARSQEPPRAEGASDTAKASARAPEQPGAPAALIGPLCKIDIKGDKKDQWMRPPKAESSVTQHHMSVGGKPLDYTATAGTLIINLRVLVMNGYYDLATPFSATEYVMSHLGLPAGMGSRIEMKYYESGHMMYVHPASMAKWKRDLDAFIDSTSRQ